MAKAEASVEELVGMIERGELRLPEHDQGLDGGQLSNSNDIDFDKGWQSAAMSSEQLAHVAGRWRYQRR